MKKIIVLALVLAISLLLNNCAKSNRNWDNPVDPANIIEEEPEKPYFQSYMLPEMVSIPGANPFLMGRPAWESGNGDEQPAHNVIVMPFHISKY